MQTTTSSAAKGTATAKANATTKAITAEQLDPAVLKAYCDAWEQSFLAANQFHTVSVSAEDRKHIAAGLIAAFAVTGTAPLAKPVPKKEYAWECNECGSQEYTMAVSETDVNQLGCGSCGGDEWHKAEVRQSPRHE
jgi:hypothetical protein